VTLRAALRRLLHGDVVPEGFAGRLEPDERVLAVARTTDGAHLVVTSWGLWLPPTESDRADGPRRIGWHLVSRAVWRNGALAVVEAVEEDEIPAGEGTEGDGPPAVLLADLPARRFRLADAGHLPEAVHTRVEGSVRSRHHRELPGGGAWFVQRKVPGRDGTVLQVRPDAGTDRAVVVQVAADVARALGRGPLSEG
jgi:hypothetical protein